jgi:uncharacterized protein YukE
LTDITFQGPSLPTVHEHTTPRGNTANQAYEDLVEHLQRNTNPTLSVVLQRAYDHLIRPTEEATQQRRDTDTANKHHQNRYKPATLQQIADSYQHRSASINALYHRLIQQADDDAPPFDPLTALDSKRWAVQAGNYIQDNPETFQPLLLRVPHNHHTGLPPTTPEEAMYAVTQLIRMHKGEVRLVSGEWTRYPGPCPTQNDADHGHLHHAHYIHDDEIIQQINSRTTPPTPPQGRTTISTPTEFLTAVLAKDPLEPDHYHLRRSGHAWTLDSLFTMLGHRCTAEDLYRYYLTLPVLLTKSQRGPGTTWNNATQNATNAT